MSFLVLLLACFSSLHSNPTNFSREVRFSHPKGAGTETGFEEPDAGTRKTPLQQSSRIQMEQDDVDDYNNDVLLETVSDAEALLACRAYLQRRKRWGPWIRADQRKDLRRRFLGSIKEMDHFSGSGFFWEDPSQLNYLHSSSELPLELTQPMLRSHDSRLEGLSDSNLPPEVETELQDEGIWEPVSIQGSMGRGNFIPLVDDPLLGDDSHVSSSFLERGPSAEHVRRSEAAKRTWADPLWKDQWYEKRWGGRPEATSAETRKLKRLENRLRELDPSVLENEALASMTEEEITEAVIQYITLGRKRKRALHDRGDSEAIVDVLGETDVTEGKPTSALDRYVSDDENAKRELQKKRSMRARSAYYARREKQQGNHSTSSVVPKQSAVKRNAQATTENSPEAALQRIEDCLASLSLPEIADVELILQPSRLSGRKDALLQILSGGFGLRGKCIPCEYGHGRPSESFKFASTVPITELGQFVLYKLST